MLAKDQLLAIRASKPPVEVSVPGWPDSVQLRYPTFKEWHGLVSMMRVTDGGKEASAEQVAQVIGVCLSTPDGARMLNDSEALRLLQGDYEAVMFLYGKCWDTVLKATGAVEDAEKN
jgi:hypothetical protein